MLFIVVLRLNLCSLQGSDVSSHRLKVHSAYYTPVDTHLIPTGAVEPVQGTPLDLRAGPCLGESLPQISGGLDHNYVLHTEERDRTPLATDPGV
jgi:aldose 1-epimerase